MSRRHRPIVCSSFSLDLYAIQTRRGITPAFGFRPRLEGGLAGLPPAWNMRRPAHTTPHSDSLRTTPDFGGALYQGSLPWLSTSPTGAGGSPQLTNRLSLHAASLTPERFQAAPESTAWTAAFAHNARARPARSLTGACFDAAEFMFIAACRYAPPRFDAQLSPNAGEFASGLLWRFARVGLSPTGRLALVWALAVI